MRSGGLIRWVLTLTMLYSSINVQNLNHPLCDFCLHLAEKHLSLLFFAYQLCLVCSNGCLLMQNVRRDRM